jgi:hypothetical protein
MNYIRYDGVAPKAPLDLNVEPDHWSSTNLFTVKWTDPKDASGIEVGAFYIIGSDPPESQEEGKWLGEKPFILNDVPEGDNILYLWLSDVMGNSDHNNYAEAKIRFDATEPSLKHVPVKNAKPEKDIIINVEADDQGSGVLEVTLYFKQKGAKEYNDVKMERSGNTFTYTIGADFTSGDGLEYYIKAIDRANPPNTAYYGRSGSGNTEPTTSGDIDITIDKGGIISGGAIYLLIAAIVIIIVLLILFQFGYLKPMVNKILRREEAEKAESTAPKAKRIIPSETQSYRSAPTVRTGAGSEVDTGETPTTPLPTTPAPAALPEATTKVYRKCPICSSMLTEETKCVYCGWNSY